MGYFRLLTTGQTAAITPKKVYRDWDACKAARARVLDRIQREPKYAGNDVRGVSFPSRTAAVEADVSNYAQYGGRHLG